MNHKVIITDTSICGSQIRMCATVSEQRLVEVRCRKAEQESILGNIYVGRVQKVVPNIRAAFIEIQPGLACYYSMEEAAEPIFVKKIPSKKLVQGDELLVQVTRESVKTKAPTVSANLNVTGRYLVLTSGDHRLGFSSKLTKLEKEHYREVLSGCKNENFGIIVRTNAREVSDELLLQEYESLKEKITQMIRTATMRTCFSCVSRTPESYMKYLQNSYQEGFTEIITDLPEVFESIRQQQESDPSFSQIPLRLYEDNLLPLAALYNLNKQTEDALQKKVWLKSGGYLVIEPTEALTVVDVNTGKSVTKKDRQEHFLKINLEAAEETAAQIRLRNISGIVIIDFINLEREEDQKTVMEHLRRCVREDSVPVQVVDMTRLNLVELTRKKVEKSLAEQLTE